MASKINQTTDLSEQKRKIFFERLSPKTTRDSLEEYLSRFAIERCQVPCEEGKNKGYGSVIFFKASSVDNIMLQRPHRIDGQHVKVYRSVPNQGPLKDNKGVEKLIVSGIKKGSITKSDLEQYFAVFGTIDDINMIYDENSCCIKFNDYDAVDKALLNIPHILKETEVSLKKDSRNTRSGNVAPPNISQVTFNDNTHALPKKSNLKQVQIDSQIISVNIPKKIYCIHIINLPSNVDAEYLSTKFNCFIDNIVIAPRLDNQSSSSQCWLKGIDDLQMAENFVRRWNGQIISQSEIECEIEEDKLEFCKKFRVGKCLKTSDDCDWEHIMCTANGKCSNDCRYGHREGMKTGDINNSRYGETYRIKITGFQRKLTSEMLNRILHTKGCSVDPSDENVGYITQLKTMKYARRLLAKWHNTEIDGQELQCQIELNPRSSMSKILSRSGSMSHLAAKENDSRRPDRSRQQLNNSRNTSRDSSISRKNSDSEITTLDSQEFNHEGRLLNRSLNDISEQKNSDDKRKATSAVKLSSSAHSKSQILDETADNGRKMTLLRKKTDFGSLAFLVEYKNTDKEMYERELNALKLLKGVKGVVQLIELGNLSNDDDDQQFLSKENLKFLTELPPGHSLKEFVNQIHHGGFGVLEAIQLVQNLITIIKQVHSKGVLHQNLRPENIMIEWDSKQTSADQAQLILSNFSQAYIKSEKINPMRQLKVECWYKAPQLNVESLKYSSTIDASSLCAILLWLLTNTEPAHDQELLPHQMNNVMDKLDKKITQAVRSANDNKKQFLEEIQLKTHLIDTFDIGFGYPQHQPWPISDLECRLESIRELLLPRNPKLITTEVIFKDLISTYNTTASTSSVATHVQHDIFQKASIAFQQAKAGFTESTNSQYSWSDGSCTWLDSTQTSMNERRHDDILTYYFRDGYTSSNCSIIITCLATLLDEGDCITLSIGSTINGKMSRIPIGQYSKNQNYLVEFEGNFVTALNNLLISITKERREKSE